MTERNTHTIDAANQRLGRLAVQIALLLRGKNKLDFAPHKDAGDFVVVKNIEKIKFSGKKEQQKTYYRHSGYLGSLKSKTLGEVFAKRPSQVLRDAVFGMLPKNKLRTEQINRLRIE